MKLRYTRKAANELNDILNYISVHSLQGKESVSERIRDMIALIRHYPYAGQLTSKSDLRRVTVTPYPYLIYYRVSNDTIVIHGLRHSAQKPSSMPT